MAPEIQNNDLILNIRIRKDSKYEYLVGRTHRTKKWVEEDKIKDSRLIANFIDSISNNFGSKEVQRIWCPFIPLKKLTLLEVDALKSEIKRKSQSPVQTRSPVDRKKKVEKVEIIEFSSKEDEIEEKQISQTSNKSDDSDITAIEVPIEKKHLIVSIERLDLDKYNTPKRPNKLPQKVIINKKKLKTNDDDLKEGDQVALYFDAINHIDLHINGKLNSKSPSKRNPSQKSDNTNQKGSIISNKFIGNPKRQVVIGKLHGMSVFKTDNGSVYISNI